MLSFKIISRQLFEQLSTKESSVIQQIQNLIRENENFSNEISELQSKVTISTDQQARLSKQNSKLSSDLRYLDEQYTQARKENINLKALLESIRYESDSSSKNLAEIKSKSEQLEAENNQLLGKISILEQALILQNQKLQEFEQNNQQLGETLSQMTQNLRIEKDRNHQKAKSLTENQSQIQQLLSEQMQFQEMRQRLDNEIEKLKLELQRLTDRVKFFQSTPLGLCQEELASKKRWISELSRDLSEYKHKCVTLEMQRLSSGKSLGLAHKSVALTTVEEIERAKYVALCKSILSDFNEKVKKVQTQKKEAEQKYQKMKAKINNYQYNQFRYQDKLKIYMQKLDRYERLTEKQQQEMEKIIMDFDSQLNQVILTVKQAKAPQAPQNPYLNRSMKSEKSLRSDKIDEFEMELLRQQNQSLKRDVQKLQKKQRKRLQQIESLNTEITGLSGQIRSLKEFNYELAKELEIKVNEVEILKNAILNHSPLSGLQNKSQNFSHMSRDCSGKNKSGPKEQSSSDKYEYSVSEIDTELQKRNQEILSRLQANRIEASMKAAGTHGNHGGYRLDITDRKLDFKKKPSPNSSFDSSRLSSISDTSFNDSLSNESQNSCKSYAVRKKQQNQSPAFNQLHRFLLHKNSLQ